MPIMRSIRTLHTLVVISLLTACSGPELPVFGEVVPLPVPAGENTLGPYLAAEPGGPVVLSWMYREDTGATLRFSSLGDDGWQSANDVVTDARMFVNWADLPSVRRLDNDLWVAHWLSKSADSTYAYDVLLAYSPDQGRSWQEAIRPHTDGTPTEHGFVSMQAQGDSTALLWLDGRKTAIEPTADPTATSMTLRAAVVSPDGKISDEQLVDDIVCDCCQTDVAISSDGPIAVYRNRTAGEIRDIYITRHTGDGWEPGVPIANDGWKIAGCPVNGPSIDADGDLVAIAWFSAADNEPIVRAVVSTNAGRTFSKPVVIASGRVSGHVGIAALGSESAAVSWVESGNQGKNAINIRAVNASGLVGPVTTVGHSELLRIHPQLARTNNDLVLAWTDAADTTTRVISARVPVPGGGHR